MNAAFMQPFYFLVRNIRGFVSSPLPQWPRLYGENLPRVEGSPILPKLPWASHLFIHFLNYKRRRIVPTQGHPPSRANFSPYKHFGSPSRVSLVRVEIIKAYASAVGWNKGVMFYLTWTLANFDSAGRVTVLPWTGLLHINEASDKGSPHVAIKKSCTNLISSQPPI